MPQLLGTLIKTMDVLDAMGEAAPIGVLELSRRLQMDKSGVSRILTSLKSRGYVYVREDGQYDIGIRMFELGQILQERMPVRKILMPHTDELARQAGETAFAIHYTQGQVAYLYQSVSQQEIRLEERPGMRASPWRHAAGLAILAHRDEEEVLAEFRNAQRNQEKGLPSIGNLRKHLHEVRQLGYSEYRDQEKCLISVPIKNNVTHQATAALMLGGPVVRMPTTRTRSLVKFLNRHARDVSLSLGWMVES